MAGYATFGWRPVRRGCLYAALFVVNFAASLLLIEPDLLASKIGHPAAFVHYLDLAWAATSTGVAAGALGSGLESDAAVRQAAYGYREARRRQTEQHKQQHDQQ